jgi:hypothetical protein
VEDASGNQYILSNDHVLARTNAAAISEDIIQPGLIDQSPACSQDGTEIVVGPVCLYSDSVQNQRDYAGEYC